MTAASLRAGTHTATLATMPEELDSRSPGKASRFDSRISTIPLSAAEANRRSRTVIAGQEVESQGFGRGHSGVSRRGSARCRSKRAEWTRANLSTPGIPAGSRRHTLLPSHRSKSYSKRAVAACRERRAYSIRANQTRCRRLWQPPSLPESEERSKKHVLLLLPVPHLPASLQAVPRAFVLQAKAGSLSVRRER